MWLKCKVMLGQYSGECAIKGNLYNNKEFSLFAEKKDVNYEGKLSVDKPIDGWVKVVPRKKRQFIISKLATTSF